jgi:hypothetical protein
MICWIEILDIRFAMQYCSSDIDNLDIYGHQYIDIYIPDDKIHHCNYIPYYITRIVIRYFTMIDYLPANLDNIRYKYNYGTTNKTILCNLPAQIIAISSYYDYSHRHRHIYAPGKACECFRHNLLCVKVLTLMPMKSYNIYSTATCKPYSDVHFIARNTIYII